MNYNQEIYNQLKYFQRYLRKGNVEKRLSGDLTKKFQTEYKKYFEQDKDDKYIVVKALSHMFQNGLIKKDMMEDILINILEDSLFNTFCYTIEDERIFRKSQRFQDWKLPNEMDFLGQVNSGYKNDDFIICGFNALDTDEGYLEYIRLFLIDKNSISIQSSRRGIDADEVFPTIIDINFKQGLLLIRTQEIENIANQDPKISTMSGRLENTLDFINKIPNFINFSQIRGFEKTMFKIEESILKEKREKAEKLAKEVKNDISLLTNVVDSKFPSERQSIKTFDFIETAVKTVIANSISNSTENVITTLRFKNETSEISIDSENSNCISANSIYWVNLAVLLEVSEVTYLKLSLYLEKKGSIVTLSTTHGTAHVKVLKRTLGEMPNQDRFNRVIEYIFSFMEKR